MREQRKTAEYAPDDRGQYQFFALLLIGLVKFVPDDEADRNNRNQ